MTNRLLSVTIRDLVDVNSYGSVIPLTETPNSPQFWLSCHFDNEGQKWFVYDGDSRLQEIHQFATGLEVLHASPPRRLTTAERLFVKQMIGFG